MSSVTEIIERMTRNAQGLDAVRLAFAAAGEPIRGYQFGQKILDFVQNPSSVDLTAPFQKVHALLSRDGTDIERADAAMMASVRYLAELEHIDLSKDLPNASWRDMLDHVITRVRAMYGEVPRTGTVPDLKFTVQI